MLVNLIRHGEKSDASGDSLTSDGLNRAQYLGRCMSAGRTAALPLGKPTFIMAAEVDPHKSHRARDTVGQLAQALGLQVDLRCDRDQAKCFAKQLKTLPANSTVVVAWEHLAIPSLVKELAVPNAGAYAEWPSKCKPGSWSEPSYCTGSKCYDAIWQVTMTRKAGKKDWVATGIQTFQEGFEGAADSPCTLGLAPALSPLREAEVVV